MITTIYNFCLAMLLLGLALSAMAEEIRDWPCDATYAKTFSADDVWGGPLPAALPPDWNQDPAVKAVVNFAAAPENKAKLGRREIEKYAATLNHDRQTKLLGVYAGVLAEANGLRGFLLEGVREYILRAKILQEHVEKSEAMLVSLPADGDDEIQRQRKGYQEARSMDARNLDDVLEEAEFLCHRYTYLDKKIRLLTAAIREAL